jgi:hypothetical protein
MRGVGKTGEGCKKGEDFNPLSSPSKGPNSKSVHGIWLKMELDLYIITGVGSSINNKV